MKILISDSPVFLIFDLPVNKVSSAELVMMALSFFVFDVRQPRILLRCTCFELLLYKLKYFLEFLK